MKVLVFLLKSLISSKLQYNTTPIKAQQNVMYVMHCCAEPHDKLKLCNYKEWVFFRCVGRSVTKAKSAGLRLVKSLGAVVISDHCADPIGCLKRCCHVTLPECNKTHLGFAVCERDMWETWRGGGLLVRWQTERGCDPPISACVTLLIRSGQTSASTVRGHLRTMLYKLKIKIIN